MRQRVGQLLPCRRCGQRYVKYTTPAQVRRCLEAAVLSNYNRLEDADSPEASKCERLFQLEFVARNWQRTARRIVANLAGVCDKCSEADSRPSEWHDEGGANAAS